MMEMMGVDVGGSGIKGAPVDLETGELLAAKFRLATPKSAKPKPVAKTVAKVVRYFDWDGPRDTVKEYGKNLEKACEKSKVKFWGIYGPAQDKWNFVAVLEAETWNDFSKPLAEASRLSSARSSSVMLPNMPYAIMKYFSKVYP